MTTLEKYIKKGHKVKPVFRVRHQYGLCFYVNDNKEDVYFKATFEEGMQVIEFDDCFKVFNKWGQGLSTKEKNVK